jgi:hypothetical protein
VIGPIWLPWSAVRIERGRMAADGPLPAFGSTAWQQLGDTSPVKIAAVIVAAEAWRYESDPMVIADRLRYELAVTRDIEDREYAVAVARCCRIGLSRRPQTAIEMRQDVAAQRDRESALRTVNG